MKVEFLNEEEIKTQQVDFLFYVKRAKQEILESKDLLITKIDSRLVASNDIFFSRTYPNAKNVILNSMIPSFTTESAYLSNMEECFKVLNTFDDLFTSRTLALPIAPFQNKPKDFLVFLQTVNYKLKLINDCQSLTVYFYGDSSNMKTFQSIINALMETSQTPEDFIGRLKFKEQCANLSLDEFIKQFKTEKLDQFIRREMTSQNLTSPEIYKTAQITKQDFSKFLSAPTLPKTQLQQKYNNIAILLTLKLPYQNFISSLSKRGFTFSDCEEKDLIIQYFILRHCYNIEKINMELHKRGLTPLGNSIE